MNELHRNQSPRRRRTGVLTLTALIGLAPFLFAGCDSTAEKAETDAIETVQRRMEAINADAANPGDPTQRADLYTQAIATLQPARDSDHPARRAAARSLTTRAQAGLGELQADAALQLRSKALEEIIQAGRLLDRRANHLDLARALVAHDPSDEMSHLRSEFADREQALATVEAERVEVEGRIADLRSRMEEFIDSARELRARENQLRIEVLDMSAEERSSRMEDVYVIQRQADAEEVRAGNLEAELASVSPELNRIGNEVERYRSQRDLLRQSMRQLELRLESAREQADANRTQAAEAARSFDRMILEIEERLDGPITEAFDLAIRSYQSAIGTARSNATGPGADRGVAQMTLGRLHQEFAALQRARAQMWETLAAMTRKAAQSEHPLPERDRYTALTTRAEELRRDALIASSEAFGVARDSYQQADVRGEASTLIERVVEEMNALQQAMREQAGVESEPVSMLAR
ncbi:MAG: hypothetical protein EA376_02780 [Phycisphaeraceae bacterium]|nr:MAG: hypothetical protein EA376_02780 [Phycisphaeraceae bacterium]